MNSLKGQVARKTRQFVPNPKVWAALDRKRVPSRSVAGRRAAMTRPEGLSFAPGGDLMAVANSMGGNITIYGARPSALGGFAAKPTQTISGPNLRYVHDVAFSPDGSILSAAGRDSEALSFYAREPGGSGAFSAEPVAVLVGAESALAAPAGVAFHPSGEWLAVVNRKVHGVTFYRCSGAGLGFQIDEVPIQVVAEEDLLRRGMSPPHDMDFSNDGSFLAVSHKRYGQESKGRSGVSVLKVRSAQGAGVDPEPIFQIDQGEDLLHSAAWQPSGDVVAFTDERKQVSLFTWDPQRSSLIPTGVIQVYQEGRLEGPKGLAFTSDGRYLGVSTVLDQVLFYKV